MRACPLLCLSCSFLLVAACGSGPTDPGAEPAGPSADAAGATDAAASTSRPDAGARSDGGAEAGAAPDAGAFVPTPHPPYPTVPKGSGVVLATMRLVTIVAANEPLAAQLFDFGDHVAQGPWWTAVATEYGVGKGSASLHVTGPAITVDQTSTSLIAYIGALVASGAAPAPDNRTLYVVYLPAGTRVTDSSSYAYHDVLTDPVAGPEQPWAVVGRNPPPYGESELDQLTTTASHEIIEAATDPSLASYHLALATAAPWTGSIWSAVHPGHIEVGDLCEHTRVREADGFLYQRSWSNVAAATGGDPCVPALARPYVDVSAARPWTPATPGQSVVIPFTGWSTARTDAWLLTAGVDRAHGALATLSTKAGLTLSTPLGIGTATHCGPRFAMNDGVTGTLTVDVPASAQSGDYAVVSVYSFHENPVTCDPGVEDDDEAHFWPIGVYVP